MTKNAFSLFFSISLVSYMQQHKLSCDKGIRKDLVIDYRCLHLETEVTPAQP